LAGTAGTRINKKAAYLKRCFFIGDLCGGLKIAGKRAARALTNDLRDKPPLNFICAV
jgi:hypothetical protein